MNIAIVGTGYVCDYYLVMMKNHPELQLSGIMDIDNERVSRVSKYHSVPVYSSLSDILVDSEVSIVLNLTNPKSHYDVSKACLEAGKHVYSEKPLAVDFNESRELTNLANARGLYIASAPCSVLSESAQSVWKALRDNEIGAVRLVYAEMDDGMLHLMRYRKWKSASGHFWPYKDEFETGCTLEHAGYLLTWLVAFFGPAESVTSFSSCQVEDKKTDIPLDYNAPDFSVGCIKFVSGVVARLTTSIVAPIDHSLKIYGDGGEIIVKDSWLYDSPIYIRKRNLISKIWKKKYPLVRKLKFKYSYKSSHNMDYCRGVAELAAAIRESRPCRLSNDFSLHVVELALAIQNSQEMGSLRQLETSCGSMEPMDWAK